jgi:hypothetical protein
MDDGDEQSYLGKILEDACKEVQSDARGRDGFQ